MQKTMPMNWSFLERRVTRMRVVTISNARATALAWWRSTHREYRKCLVDDHYGENKGWAFMSKVPSIVIERIFIKFLERERGGR